MSTNSQETEREQPSLEAAVCAVVCEEGGVGELFFTRVAERAKGAGLRLAGALQLDEPREGRKLCDIYLSDLASGRRTRISEDRGELAEGCRLDLVALTEAAGMIEREIEGGAPDLVILNKFGKAEAEEGRGLRGAIAMALEGDIPVLIGVAKSYAPALKDFAGDLCAVVSDEASAWRWLAARLGERFGESEGNAH
jgi:hypothetical protein